MKKILHELWNSIVSKKNSKPVSKVPSHLKFRFVNVSVVSNRAHGKRHAKR